MARSTVLLTICLMFICAAWADDPATAPSAQRIPSAPPVPSVLPGPSVLPVLSAPSARVLFLVGEGFNAGEFWTPYLGLQAVGHRVSVAGVSRGVIPAGSKNRALDIVADLSLDDVDPASFDVLVIPGGAGPANLEKHPRSVEIARAFLASKEAKLTAAICHGPRLLAHTGLMRDRVATCLNTVKDELPELWKSGDFGTYRDDSVVIDRNLITSRYPNDAEPFTHAIARRLDPSIPARDRTSGTVLIIGGDQPLPAGMLGAASAAGLKPRLGGDGLLDLARPNDTIVLLAGERLDGMFKDEARRSKLLELTRAGRVIAVGEVPENLLDRATRRVTLRPETLVETVSQALREVLAIQKPEPTTLPTDDPRPLALIVVGEGFDDRVVVTMQAVLAARGYRVVLVSDLPVWVRGQSGLPVLPDLSLSDAETLSRVSLVIAPGHVRPADAERDGLYRDWLLRREAAGHSLIVFGFDSLLLGNDPRFKGMKFASSDQAVWSFKGGASYSNEPVLLSGPKLLTAKGASALPEVLNLLDELTR